MDILYSCVTVCVETDQEPCSRSCTGTGTGIEVGDGDGDGDGDGGYLSRNNITK